MSRLLTPTSLAAVDPVAALHRLPTDGDDAPARLVPGSRLFVEVIAPLADGGVRARALDGSGEYRLAFNAPPGTRLEIVVSDDEGSAATPLPDRAPRDAVASISQAARLVAALAPHPENAARPAIVIGRVPLLAEGPADSAALGRALAQALAASGLFYEAHQAQWVSGARPRESLLQEPQARVTLREVRPARARETAEREEAMRAAVSLSPDRGPPTAADIESVVHRNTVPLVQQQLAALETGAIMWRGELWRGQVLEWEVRRDDGRDAERDPARTGTQPGGWTTRFRLTLPALGMVQATIALDANGVEVRVAAYEPSALDALRANVGSLASALAQAGLNVRRLEVQRGA